MRAHLAFHHPVCRLFTCSHTFTPFTRRIGRHPDEPAHYNYIRQLVAGSLPVMEAGDYDQAYQNAVIGSRFDPSYSVEFFLRPKIINRHSTICFVTTSVYSAFSGTLRQYACFVLLGAVVVTCCISDRHPTGTEAALVC